MFRSSLFLLFLILTNVDALAQENKVRIACIGNSITQGSHLENPKEDCYPSQLNEMLRREYKGEFEVGNFGLSGRNMLKNGKNPIWAEPKFKEALEWKPDICLIMLGTNDSPPVTWERYGDEFLKDYLNMIDTFEHQNPEVQFIICAPSPIWEGHPYGGQIWEKKHNDSIMVNHIIPVIQHIAERKEVLLLDFHTPLIDHLELFPDRLHPNPKGAQIIAKMIFGAIKENEMIEEAQKK